MYNKHLYRLISIILSIITLICAFSVNSFAETGNKDFLASDTTVSSYYYDQQSGQFVSISNSQSVVTFSNRSAFRVIANVPTASQSRIVDYLELTDLHANHEYTIDFYYAYAMASYSQFYLEFEVLNGNGTVIDVQTLYTSPSTVANNTWERCYFSFVPDLSNVHSGYSMRLAFRFVTSQALYTQTCYLSNNIYFNDNDDDSGFFQSIIDWLQSIASSISTLGTNIGNWFSQLGTTIGGYFTTLGNNLNTWLTSVKDGIVNKLQSVQAAITSAIDGIEQWFIDLGEDIGDFFTMLKNYILYFQHPVTLNADGVPVDSNGNPVYTNPFADTLDTITDTLDDWFDSLDDFILTIQSTNQQVTSYLATFTNIFNRFNNGVPIFGIIIALALIIIVIRKILGR